MWDADQIPFSEVALCRAPLNEEKSNPAMKAIRDYRENPLINLGPSYEEQQQQLLISELYFGDAAKGLQGKLDAAAREFAKSAKQYGNLFQGYDYYL